MFLTGQRNSMDNLVRVGKNYVAINQIIYNLKYEDNYQNQSQFQQALDLYDKVNLELLSNLRNPLLHYTILREEGLYRTI